MSTSDVSLSLANKAAVLTHVPTQRTFSVHTLPTVVAKLMTLIACIFPCICQKPSPILIGNQIHYLSLSSLRNNLYFSRTLQEQAIHNTAALKTLALHYLCPSKVLSATVPMRSVNEDAAQLAQTFLSLKSQMRQNSGYHVQLTSENSGWKLTIQSTGREDMPITLPGPASLRECPCCQTCFEHTFKTTSHPLLVEISARIAPYNLFAVFSHSGNLLLVPDTRNPQIHVRDFPHLFSLNASQLQNIFAATLTTDAFLRSRDSSYVTKTIWHNGIDGSQTVPVLHVRQEGLRNVL